MRTLALAVSACLLFAAAAASAQPTEAERDRIAERVVTQSARVQAGDRVLISGSVRDMGLLEDLAVHVRRAGGFPLITVGSDRLTRRMYDDVPEKWDSQLDETDLLLLGGMDVLLSVESGEDPTLLSHVSPERLQARAKAGEALGQIFQRRGVRNVDIGNDMYPSAWRAKRHGVSEADLSKAFWSGVAADTGAVQANAEAARALLAKAKEVRITHPNGTDLTFAVQGRKVLASDGVISDADRAEGGAGVNVWLPAGDVYLTPVPGTAKGRLVIDRSYMRGSAVEGLDMTFEGGRATSMKARSGFEVMKGLYEAAGEGRDEFGFLNIGVNPGVQPPAGGSLTPWMAGGMVTVGLGGNVWAGGDNAVTFGTTHHLPGATVLVDGKPLVDRGALKLGGR